MVGPVYNAQFDRVNEKRRDLRVMPCTIDAIEALTTRARVQL
jgi:hypothetical protein